MYLIFGRRVSEEYSQLLSQYAIIFHALIDAQLSGDVQAVDENINRLYQNVMERALFVESINPYWSASVYEELFFSYIRHILETSNAILEHDSARDIELYDILNEHTDRMGDIFAQGIYEYLTSGLSIGQQPLSDSVPCITHGQMNDIYTIRMLWFELIVWVRNYMIMRYTNTGNPEEAIVRLIQVVDDYTTALQKFYPEMDADQYAQLFYSYIFLIRDFVTAMIENNVEELNRTTMELYRNADERAAFLASIDPAWDEEARRDELYANLKNTFEESNAFLTQDYALSIDIFTRLLDQAEMASSVLSTVLFEHITTT